MILKRKLRNDIAYIVHNYQEKRHVNMRELWEEWATKGRFALGTNFVRSMLRGMSE